MILFALIFLNILKQFGPSEWLPGGGHCRPWRYWFEARGDNVDCFGRLLSPIHFIFIMFFFFFYYFFFFFYHVFIFSALSVFFS